MKGTFKVAKSSAEMLARYKVHINRLVPVCTTNFHLSFKLLTRCSPLLHIRMNSVGSL